MVIGAVGWGLLVLVWQPTSPRAVSERSDMEAIMQEPQAVIMQEPQRAREALSPAPEEAPRGEKAPLRLREEEAAPRLREREERPARCLDVWASDSGDGFGAMEASVLMNGTLLPGRLASVTTLCAAKAECRRLGTEICAAFAYVPLKIVLMDS